MDLGKKLKQLRNDKGLTQAEIAEMLEISTSGYGYYEQGKNIPPQDMINKLADIHEVSLDYLHGRSKSKMINKLLDNNNKITSIPVLGNIPAGVPIEAIENIEDYEEIVISRSSDETDYFALKVRGDSMTPRIKENDVVICRKQPSVDNNDIAVVMINGCDATLKRIKRTESGITLIPDNPNYDVKFYSNEEIETTPIKIIGKVIELRGKF